MYRYDTDIYISIIEMLIEHQVFVLSGEHIRVGMWNAVYNGESIRNSLEKSNIYKLYTII